ncbi:MAG: AMP-binding protein [Rhizobiaceae bacterium]|nr:AMP-binding protein [Rhizobiaceae bacterium]
MYEAFLETVRNKPDSACICVPAAPGRDYLPDGVEWSYGEVEASVARLMELYRRAGYGHGHVVALMMANRPEFMLHWFAHNALGICTVPINPDYRAPEITFILKRSGTDLLVSLPEYLDVTTQAASSAELPHPVPVVSSANFDGSFDKPRKAMETAPPGRDTLSGILFTSGTSGLPKACMLTNEYMFFAGERYNATGGLMTIQDGQERLYNPLPLFYSNSFGISNAAMILTGNCMIFPDRFHPKSWWKELAQTRATMIHYLGIIPPVLLSLPHDPAEREHQVRFGVGAGTTPLQRRQFHERFGLRLVEVWGMTEVGICIIEHKDAEVLDDVRTIGWPLHETEVRVANVNNDNDEEAPRGEVGELLIRRAGPDPRKGLFGGYLGDEETMKTVWRNDWFHTGDLVRWNDDGRLVFVDRLKDMIRRSGQNIAAAEVEVGLFGLEGIGEVAVIAAPDELRDEEVMACIVPAAGYEPNSDLAHKIFAGAVDRLAYFKLPGWIAFVDELPRTSTEKLRKSELSKKIDELRSSGKCFDLRGLKKPAKKSAA